MKLDGMHHITMITGDAQRNVDFYADVLGLRLVKKTVNFDAPEAYHLYFGDEQGSPGSILTWFEFAGARRGPRRRGDDPHDPARRRVREERSTSGPPTGSEGLLERALARRALVRGLRRAPVRARGRRHGNPPLKAVHPEVPAQHAIPASRAHVRTWTRGTEADRELLTETLGFTD